MKKERKREREREREREKERYLRAMTTRDDTHFRILVKEIG
jgi:hypothetical protein